MKYGKPYYLLVGALLAWTTYVRAQSLEDVVSAALARSPNLVAAHARIDGASSQFREMRSQRYPRFSVRSSYMRGDNPVYVFGSLLEQGAFGAQNFAIDKLNNPSYVTNVKNALDVGVPLFTAFDLSSGVKIRRYEVAQAEAEYEAVTQNTRFLVAQAYLDTLLKKEVLDDIEKRIDSASAEVDGARRLNAKGLVLGSDYYAAEAILSGLRAQRVRVSQELSTARKRLAVLTGLAPESLVLSGRLSPSSYRVEGEDVLVTDALKKRQDAVGAALGLKMADVGLTQASRSFLPTVEAFASVETNTEDFESNPTNRTVGLRSHFPIGDPAYFARKSSARASVKALIGQKERVDESIRMDVATAYGQFEGARSSVPLMEESARQAEKSLGLFRPLYREGRQSILDVLRAEDGLLRARQALLETYFHVHMAYAQLQLATGRFDSATITAIHQQIEVQP